MTELKCQVLVIGAGPGGYVCAIRAGQLGLDTMIVEASALGGTCLNVGCIPSKAIIHAGEVFAQARMNSAPNSLGITAGQPDLDFSATMKWKADIVKRLTGGVGGLLNKAKVRHIAGFARFIDGKTVEVKTPDGGQRVRAEHIVIATGSVPVELPHLPFGGDVISSTEALALDEVPERLAVVGGGYIGLEIGTAYRKLGAEVTVIELGERILPQYDAALTRPVSRHLEQLGVRVLTGARAKERTKNGLTIEVGGNAEKLETDQVLVTVGRKPLTEGWGIEELSLDMDGKFIRIDSACRTSMRGVYAIGDVTGEPMLAHRAMAQGTLVAEIIAGGKSRWDREAIPAICFTDPEIVTVGMSPDDAKRDGVDADVAVFPFTANGRAMTVDDEAGFVRIVCRRQDGLVLGVQAVGEGVSELSAAFALAIEMGATAEDIAGTIHAHPTRSEAFQEAALGALGHALHT